MASSLVTTPGSMAADSYISMADADTYFSKLPNATDWSYENGGDARTDASKDALLRAATLGIDQYMGSFGVTKLLATGYYEQALTYPCRGFEWSAATASGHCRVVSAESGSTTTFVSASLQYSRSDQYVGGAAYVSQTTDMAAPVYEIQAISDYNAATYTVTTAAFSAAIGAGDSIAIIMPVPRWLWLATCMQALFLANRMSGAANQAHAGVSSESTNTGESRSFSVPGIGGHLHIDVQRLIDANMPRFAVLER